MEQKFNNNRLDLQILREFCEREGEEIAYRKGDQLEREGDPARWFAFVSEGCFKYGRTRQTLWSAVQMLTQKLCCQTIHDCPKVVPLHYESE